MKQYSIIYNDALPYLRQVNPLKDNQNLVSVQAYQEHEAQYIKEAVRIVNPLPGQREYFANELEGFWRFTEDNGETWVEVSEPNFIDTTSSMYQYCFRVRPRKEVPYQERVKDWIINTFDESQIIDIPERCFRFMEEAIELGQSLGMSREDMYRLITYTYGRPPGEPIQEVGGVMVTLNGLATAAGIDVTSAAESELSNNIKKAPAIREKWLNKIAVSPLT